MFLQKVYSHNKFLFVAIILFVAEQLFVNYKHGAVLSPFYHYGMYSGTMGVQNSYYILEVEQNEKRLRGQNFSSQQWDRIMLPLQYFAGINQSNRLYQADIKRLLAKVKITGKDENFLQSCGEQQFEEWYKKYLGQVTGQPTSTIKIYSRVYHFAAGKLMPTDSVTVLSQLCN